ncbi:MAG: hypothetical protein ACOC0J_00835, partial [Myxococcota bacterium]
MIIALAFALLLLASLLSACPDDTELVGGCLDDAECVETHGPGFYCSDRYSPSQCLCDSDTACGPGEFCNQAGICQASVGCYTNEDCPEDSVCDTLQNRCIQEGRCTSDLHCPIGEVCDELTNECRIGCRISGDCPLGQACR